MCIGAASVGTIGAVVALNLVGFPEVEIAEGGVTFGIVLEMLTEPMSSMSVGFVTGVYIGGSVLWAAPVAISLLRRSPINRAAA